MPVAVLRISTYLYSEYCYSAMSGLAAGSILEDVYMPFILVFRSNTIQRGLTLHAVMEDLRMY